MTLRALLVLCALVVACGGDDAPDATSDTGSDADTGANADTGLPPVDVVFAAEPDPAEPTGCADTPPASGEVRAKHVECAAELATGHLAMGRIGDIVIENERVRFIVRTGTESASTIGAPPGGLVDAVRGDRPDALKEVFPLFDFASMDVTALEIVDAGVTSGEARVRVLFDDAPIQIIDTVAPGLSRGGRVRGQLDYVLSADSDALSIEVGITTRPGVPTARLTPGLLALLGGQELVEPGYGVVGDGSPGGASRASKKTIAPGATVRTRRSSFSRTSSCDRAFIRSAPMALWPSINIRMVGSATWSRPPPTRPNSARLCRGDGASSWWPRWSWWPRSRRGTTCSRSNPRCPCTWRCPRCWWPWDWPTTWRT